LNDDEFTGYNQWAQNICDLITRENIKASFELRTGIRVDKTDESLLTKMKSAGFFFFAFGAESSDANVLKLARKGITASRIKRAVKLVNTLGLESSGFFMIGLPGDTLKKFRKTLAFAKSLNLSEVRFYTAVPYPGTDFYSWVLKYGRLLYPPEIYLNRYDRLQRDPVFETKEFPAKERQIAYDLGEQFFVERLFVKTLGIALARPFIFLSKNNMLRSFLLKIGFRFTVPVRKLQKFRRIPMHRYY
jgi:radical SAM superfamily enzyme YgiQ (UPF0313 family)